MRSLRRFRVKVCSKALAMQSISVKTSVNRPLLQSRLWLAPLDTRQALIARSKNIHFSSLVLSGNQGVIRCTWNKIGNVKSFHLLCIDDLMLVHKKGFVATDRVQILNSKCGWKDQLNVTRGKLHEWSGTTTDLPLKQEVAASQCDFVKKSWIGSHEELKVPHCTTSMPV